MSDKRDAAQLSVGLSGQLINAALTMIALSGAFLTFILDKKSPSWGFYTAYILSFLFFAGSVYFGGRGTDFVKRNGETGQWMTSKQGDPDWFNLQAISLLIAVILLAILPFLGKTKTETDVLVMMENTIARRDSLQAELFKKLLRTKPLKDTIYIIKPVPIKEQRKKDVSSRKKFNCPKRAL